MQLFLITPILIHLIWTSKKIGFLVLGFLAAASSVLRFWVAYQHELTSVVYFGIPISKMFAVANLSYILPTHRATIYLIGVACAYLLKYSNPNPSFTKIKVAFLWCFFLSCFLGSWIWPYHMVQKNYIYNKVEASINAALYPIFFGVSISFGVYTFNRNLSGWFGKMFDWKYFQIATKVAYALYLVQFPVFFYNVGLTKHVDEYQSYYQLQIFETVAIILCSLLLVFSIEMPFQNIKRAIFDDRSHHKTKVTAEISRPTLTQRKFKAG
jgi:peptidoglycan/LPS O-acetylase OafA/YrhL